MTPTAKEKLLTIGKFSGMLIVGLLSGHAATQYTNAPTAKAQPTGVTCACQCITPKPDPIKIEFVQPGRK